MVDIESITTGLKQDSSGIWFSDKRENVSYPSDGNEIFTISKTYLSGSSTGTIAFCQL